MAPIPEVKVDFTKLPAFQTPITPVRSMVPIGTLGFKDSIKPFSVASVKQSGSAIS